MGSAGFPNQCGIRDRRGYGPVGKGHWFDHRPDVYLLHTPENRQKMTSIVSHPTLTLRLILRVIVTAIVLFAATTAAGACIPPSELKKKNPNMESYIHELTRRGGKHVSVYREGDSFERFIEVTREGNCITVVQSLTNDELVARYLEYPEPWIAEQEGMDNEGMPEDYEPEVASAPEPPVRLTEYDNINVAALLDLYEGYGGLRACFKAREGQSPAYLTRSEMQRAEAALRKDEAEILSREPGIDREAVAQAADENNKFFASIILMSGKIKMNYEHRDACRKLASLFPPGIQNAKLKKREIIEKKNTGGGLIVPQDPRFR